MPHPTSEPRRSGGTLASFLAELRRRHVVRVGLAYAATVFVALQLAEIVLPAFLFGREADAWLRLLVVGSTLFSPVVVVLAWVYEITPAGVRPMAALDREAGRQPQGHLMPRLALLGLTVVATGGAGAVWWRADTAQTRAEAAWRAARSAAFATSAVAEAGSVQGLVVLPLRDLGDDASGAWFTSGLEEVLVTRLGEMEDLRVVSRTSAARAEGHSVDRIGRELGVDAVVEGAVIRVGQKVRITLRLIRAASDHRVWGAELTGDLGDPFALYAEAADAVVQGVRSQGAATPHEGPQPARVVSVDPPAPDPPVGTVDSTAP